MWILPYSLKMLRGKSRRTFFSPIALIAVFGIAFGMAAMLGSLAIVSGFGKVYEKAILGFNAHIVVIGDGGENKEELIPALAKFWVDENDRTYWQKHGEVWRWLGEAGLFPDSRMKKLSTKGIVATTPFLFREGLAVFPEEVSGIVIKGVDPGSVNKVYSLQYSGLPSLKPMADPASLLQKRDTPYPPVIVGRQIFDRFFAGKSGERILRVLLPRTKRVSKHPTLKDYEQKFLVVGTFESGLYEFDSQFILTSLPIVEEMGEAEGVSGGFEIALDDPQKAPRMARLIEESLSDHFQAIAWDELNEPLFTAMKMEKGLFVVIMFFVLLIASFNVMGIVLMLLVDKQAEIAALSAMGMPGKKLGRLFALCGLWVGMGGLLTGSALSALFFWSVKNWDWVKLDPQIYFISKLPIDGPYVLWTVLALSSLAVCYLISLGAHRMMAKSVKLVQVFR